MVILEKNKNEKFKCQNFYGKLFILAPFFKILPDFRHRSDQIDHIWKSPLDGPLIILPSICSETKGADDDQMRVREERYNK